MTGKDDGRFHFEKRTSDVVRAIQLPTDRPRGRVLKRYLKAFLRWLGAAARIWL